MYKEVWVLYYRSTDEEFGGSFDGVYVFGEESDARESMSKLLSCGPDYVTLRKCPVLEQIPDKVDIKG